MLRFGNDVVDPLWTVLSEGGPFHARNGADSGVLRRYLDRLDETGRGEGAQALRTKYADCLK
jgi:hypothetical protein